MTNFSNVKHYILHTIQRYCKIYPTFHNQVIYICNKQYFVQLINSPKGCQPTSGLISSCLKIEMNNHLASLGRCVANMLIFPTVTGFLDQYYRYTSAAAHIPHNADLVLTENSLTGDRASAKSLS